AKTQRFFAAGDPKDTIVVERTQVHEINVGAVKDHDLARFNAGADSGGAYAVGGLCRFDQDKARQETVQVQTHMKLGSGFAPAVLRPGDAGGYQRDGAGVHYMNDAAKTPS